MRTLIGFAEVFTTLGYRYLPDTFVLWIACSSSSSVVTNPMLGSLLPILARAIRMASLIEGGMFRPSNRFTFSPPFCLNKRDPHRVAYGEGFLFWCTLCI